MISSKDERSDTPFQWFHLVPSDPKIPIDNEVTAIKVMWNFSGWFVCDKFVKNRIFCWMRRFIIIILFTVWKSGQFEIPLILSNILRLPLFYQSFSFRWNFEEENQEQIVNDQIFKTTYRNPSSLLKMKRL